MVLFSLSFLTNCSPNSNLSDNKLLWTNPSPTSNFSGSLNLQTSGYNYFVIICRTNTNTDNKPRIVNVIPIDNNTYSLYANGVGSQYSGDRKCKIYNGTITFTQSYANTCIPIEIYGVKNHMDISALKTIIGV